MNSDLVVQSVFNHTQYTGQRIWQKMSYGWMIDQPSALTGRH